MIFVSLIILIGLFVLYLLKNNKPKEIKIIEQKPLRTQIEADFLNMFLAAPVESFTLASQYGWLARIIVNNREKEIYVDQSTLKLCITDRLTIRRDYFDISEDESVQVVAKIEDMSKKLDQIEKDKNLSVRTIENKKSSLYIVE